MQVKLSDTIHGNRGGGPLHNVATTDAAGFMSAADKAILDAAAPLASPAFTGGVEIDGTLALTGVLTPAQITANQNDYNPTGLSGANVLRLDTNASGYTITGLAGGAEGRVVVLMNVGSSLFYLVEDSASSTAANRFYTEGGSWSTILSGGVAVLVYDATVSRWRVSNGRPPASSGTMESGSSVGAYVSPSVAHRHPSAAKCWGTTTGGGTPVLATSYNVTSITDTGVGQLTVTIATDFSSANWAGVVSAVCDTLDNRRPSLYSKAAGSIVLEAYQGVAVLSDPVVGYDWVFYGDQ